MCLDLVSVHLKYNFANGFKCRRRNWLTNGSRFPVLILYEEAINRIVILRSPNKSQPVAGKRFCIKLNQDVHIQRGDAKALTGGLKRHNGHLQRHICKVISYWCKIKAGELILQKAFISGCP